MNELEIIQRHHEQHANDWNLSCPLCVQEMMEVLKEEGEEE